MDNSEPQIPILYQDKHCIAVSKPANLLVHRTTIDRHEHQFLLQQLRDQIGRFLYPVHRLDKATSGVVIFAFSTQAAAQLQQQLHDNIATKSYLLVCRGYCPQQGEINHPLKPLADFKRKKANRQEKPAQNATTQFERLATFELDAAIDKYPSSRYSLVNARILTGRRHQIRRHFKHISHPIIGCPKYGKSTHNRYFAHQLQAPGLLLHAWQLHFKELESGQLIKAQAPLPPPFARVLRLFNWSVSCM